MAFVHCHNCNFDNGDFWNSYYNPPRWFWQEGIKAVFFHGKYPNPKANTVVYRARWFWRELRHFLNPVTYFGKRWWTYKAWRKAVNAGRGGCPNCGTQLCID